MPLDGTELSTPCGVLEELACYSEKNSVLVNAIAVTIRKDDEKTLKIWKEEGLKKILKT